MYTRSGFLLSTTLVAAVLLQGCGGLGGSGPPPNRPPTASFTATPASGPPPLAVTLDASASRDSDGAISTYAWEFGDGSTDTGRTVDYTYEDSGAFEVSLTVTDDDGAQASATNEIVVNVPPMARILADPVDGVAPFTVTFDAAESSDSDGEIATYEWEVADNAPISGATLEHTFEEPGVYPVQLTVTDDLGGVDEVVFEVNARDDAGVAYTVPYVPDGTHADLLRRCAYGGDTLQRTCTVGELPFLGTEFEKPTVDDVMSRVLVSHRWMGDRLKRRLREFPADIRLLARSITAIVIASDIRPAYYWAGSGAIYLDADFFWETPEERAVVTMEEDYRSGFGNDMQLRIPWRLVRNNVPLGLTAAGERAPRADRLPPFLAFLLYHELSHAADFMPASKLPSLDPDRTPWEAMSSFFADWPSSRLTRAHPLGSELMLQLARIFFHGEDPESEQLALLPGDVVDAFASDGAVDFYSYSSRFEDVADLHDAILMSYHHGFEKDIGIVGTEGDTRAEAIVVWGQRGRMTDANVIDRLRLVIDEMYPGDVQALHGYVNDRPEPLSMRRGETWAANRVLEGGADFNASGLPGVDSVSEAAGPEPLSFGTPSPRPELFGCIRLDGGVRAGLEDLLGRKVGLAESVAPHEPEPSFSPISPVPDSAP
ncbi:MAG: PKD domain-containing protein [Gammaproteobacteria bacterium]|nr:PKD domain-containing protein [Gammaproteobacteria bacterium]